MCCHVQNRLTIYKVTPLFGVVFAVRCICCGSAAAPAMPYSVNEAMLIAVDLVLQAASTQQEVLTGKTPKQWGGSRRAGAGPEEVEGSVEEEGPAEEAAAEEVRPRVSSHRL